MQDHQSYTHESTYTYTSTHTATCTCRLTFLSDGSRPPVRCMLEGEGVGEEGEAPFQWELGVGEQPSESICKLQEEGEADTQGLNSVRKMVHAWSHDT